jgi:hypothetical protein
MTLGLVILSGCAGIDPARYAAETPVLDMREYFNLGQSYSVEKMEVYTDSDALLGVDADSS